MSNLDTFAKVRALHDRTDNPGEKAAAAARMKILARKAGMTVKQAVSKLDKPAPEVVASATFESASAFSSAFNDFFNTPDMRAARAERERERTAKRAVLLAEYGSEDAVFADTPMEAALRAACEPLLGSGQTWNTIYRLDGWGGLDSRTKIPASVRTTVSEAWPLPATVVEAWAEFQATDKLASDRSTFCYDYTPHSFVEARGYVVEDLLNTLPARGLNDLRARLDWMGWWTLREITPDVEEERLRLATVRADIERMGARLREQDAEPAPVQSGHYEGEGIEHPSPVQSGRPVRRTNADKRRDVLALLDVGNSDNVRLTDREIARRAGVSPTTVGAIRRSLA